METVNPSPEEASKVLPSADMLQAGMGVPNPQQTQLQNLKKVPMEVMPHFQTSQPVAGEIITADLNMHTAGNVPQGDVTIKITE